MQYVPIPLFRPNCTVFVSLKELNAWYPRLLKQKYCHRIKANCRAETAKTHIKELLIAALKESHENPSLQSVTQDYQLSAAT